MTVSEAFAWLEAFPTSIALRESTWGYTILLTSHVISMCLFLGLVIMMDLRLAGLGNLRTPVSEIQKRLFPWQTAGMIVASITGLLLWYSQPTRYYGKVLFWTKLMLMVLAGVNAFAFHRTTYRSVARWNTDRTPPFGARIAGVLSLALWAGVVVFGRLTAYDWFTYD
jgi:uncharacterized membrane protein